MLVGLLHAGLLWKATTRPTVWTPLVGLLRMGLVVALLSFSAVSGGILPASCGWLLGFGIGVFAGWAAPWLRRQRVAAPANPTA